MVELIAVFGLTASNHSLGSLASVRIELNKLWS